jgi:ribonuclease Z
MQINPRLGGGKLGDPSLYIDIVDRKRGILFDCGLNNFSHASLRKLTEIFISHTHIDHFIGFDTVLRLNLAETKTLHVYGPPGIQRHVSGKLQGYIWNICQNLQLTIIVHEILPERILSTTLESWRGFEVTSVEEHPKSEVLLDTGEFSVRYLQLNHKTPSFGYSFLEVDSFNVQKDRLQSLGLEPGHWITILKTQADDPELQDTMLQVGDQVYPIGFLSQTLLIRKKGIKLTYLTDFLFDNRSLAEITRFAWESDILFCEAAFSEQEREKARQTYHLTAKQAGMLARMAHVRHLVLFHISKRYQDYTPLLEEAKTEFPYVE